MADKDRERYEAMIGTACQQQGLTVDDWSLGGDGRPVAHCGKWRILEDDESCGLFEGDEGEVTAEVVGAPEYDNERVSFGITVEDNDGPDEVVSPIDQLEPVN